MGHREALLKGALKCLQEKGYARTTARDLVAASGTNLGSIGYHFGSKERLLNEAISEGFRLWMERIAQAAFEASEATAWERLRSMADALFATFESNRPVAVAFVEAAAQAERSEELRKQLAQHYEDARRGMAEIVKAIVADEANEADDAGDPEIDAYAIGSLLIAVADGLMLQWLLDIKRTPRAPHILKSLEAALAAVERTPR